MQTYFVVFFSLLMTLVACGSDSSGANETGTSPATPAGTCESAGARICERACACATDGKCRVGTKTDAGATGTINFDSEQKCRDLYVTFGCLNGGTTKIDYASCDSAVAASTCVTAGNASAILLPDSCKQ
jgi:hypothetical protein